MELMESKRYNTRKSELMEVKGEKERGQWKVEGREWDSGWMLGVGGEAASSDPWDLCVTYISSKIVKLLTASSLPSITHPRGGGVVQGCRQGVGCRPSLYHPRT